METNSFITSYSRVKALEDYNNIDEITADIDMLTQENFILTQTVEVVDRYLRKRSPAVLLGMEKFLETSVARTSFQAIVTGRSASMASSTVGSISPIDTMVRSSTTSSVNRGVTIASRSNAHSFGSYKISLAAKADIVERELEENRVTMEKLRRKFESAKFLLQTEEENMRLNIEFLERTKIAVEDFLEQSTNKKSGKVTYDKILRFLEQELKTYDRLLRNIKLKAKSLHIDYKRILSQQQQRLELRERLHPIDIDKLLIENQEQLDIFEQRNKKLEDLKKIVGRKGQTLVSCKSKLNDTIDLLKTLRQDIKQSRKKYKYTEEHEVQNKNQLLLVEKVNQNIRNLNMAFKSPDILSYLEMDNKINELKLEKVAWERRCKYQTQHLALLEHQVKQLSTSPRAHNNSCKRRSTAFSAFSALRTPELLSKSTH